MEKEAFFVGGGGDHQLPNCFLNLNWDQSADHAAAQFESALSSLVSSPSSNAPPPGAAGAAADSVVIRELIGRLGSICNSGEISPPSQFQSTTTSCYSTPLSSPPKLNLMPPGGGPAGNPMAFAAANPGFAERAARFSCFGGGGARSYGQLGGLSRVSSSQSMKNALPAMDGAQLDQNERRSGGAESGNGQEEPSIASDRGKASGAGESGGGGGGRKRKAAAAASKGKGKEAPLPPMEEDSSGGAKRCKSGEGEAKAEKEDNAKPVEPPKLDYIHVRARRGQATDSHSLAERVRREKISERMKFLQDLVPGCNKVTGKAVMLDEIINYVQSLQRQVEFLSMKLSTVNPRLEFNVDGLVQKDVQMHQPRGPVAAPPPHPVFPMEGASTAAGFPYGNQPQMLPLQSLMASGMEGQGSANALDAATLRRSLGMQLPNMDSFMDASSQLGAFWEDDLQSVVQMGFGQNQENLFSSQAFQGSAPTNHMKIEL